MSSRECGCWKLLGCHEARHSRLLLMLWPRHQQTMGHNGQGYFLCFLIWSDYRGGDFQKGELLSQSNLRRWGMSRLWFECLFLIAQNNIKRQSAKQAQNNLSTEWSGEHFHGRGERISWLGSGAESSKTKVGNALCRLPRAQSCCTSVKSGSNRKRGIVTSGMALWEDMGEIQGNPKHWAEAVPTLPYWRKLPSACLPHLSRLPNWQRGISSA